MRVSEVDIAEFLGGVALMMHGTLEERLLFSFDIYDLDGSGALQVQCRLLTQTYGPM